MTRTAFETAPNLNASPRRPNALKHGLSAKRYISPEQAERVVLIREELLAVHEPHAPEECQLVDRLSIELARLYDAEAAWAERLRTQKVHAEELFDRRNHEQFQADLEAWRSSPSGLLEFFGKTASSSAWLRDLWETALSCLDHGIAFSYEQTKDLITALGSDWRLDGIVPELGRLVMSLFLADAADPETALATWVADSRRDTASLAALASDATREQTCNALARGRARWFLAKAPAVADSRTRLISVAREWLGYWNEESARLRDIDLEERERAAEHGLESGNAAQTQDSNRLMRYVMTIQRRADKLERRLLALRKMQPLRQLRSSAGHLETMFGFEPRSHVPATVAGATLPLAPQAWPATSQESAKSATRQPEKSPAEPVADDSQGVDANEDASISQNGEASPGHGVSEDRHATRNDRRPDPKELAKAWRSKRKSGFRSPARK